MAVAKKATAKTAPKKAVAKKAQPKATPTTERITGAKRTTLAKKCVTLRDKGRKSWVQIGVACGIHPRMANRLYDEVKGKGAHYGLLEGKGGRTRAA